MAGEQRPLQPGDDGGPEAVHPRPRVAALAEGGEEVLADLGVHAAGLVARRAQLADGADGRWGAHHLTLRQHRRRREPGGAGACTIPQHGTTGGRDGPRVPSSATTRTTRTTRRGGRGKDRDGHDGTSGDDGGAAAGVGGGTGGGVRVGGGSPGPGRRGRGLRQHGHPGRGGPRRRRRARGRRRDADPPPPGWRRRRPVHARRRAAAHRGDVRAGDAELDRAVRGRGARHRAQRRPVRRPRHRRPGPRVVGGRRHRPGQPGGLPRGRRPGGLRAGVGRRRFALRRQPDDGPAHHHRGRDAPRPRRGAIGAVAPNGRAGGGVVAIPVPGGVPGTAVLATEDTPGVAGVAESGDLFGQVLAPAGDGTVVVGTPREDIGSVRDAGAVSVLTLDGDMRWSGSTFAQSTAGVPGSPEQEDNFGWSSPATRWRRVGAPRSPSVCRARTSGPSRTRAARSRSR